MMSAPVSPSTVYLLTVFTACFLWTGMVTQKLERGIKYDISGNRKQAIHEGRMALPVICYDIYKEREGYILCDENGSCDGPYCEYIRCVTHVVWPKRSLPSMSGVLVGDTIVFECFEGLKYVGKNPLVCQRNGQWSGEMGECIPLQCPTLEPPLYGFLSPDPRNDPSHSHFNSTVTVRCQSGYLYHNRRPTLRCLQNEAWNSTVGTCIEKGKAHCEVPVPPSNGYNTPDGEVAEYREEIRVACNQGFTYTGQSTRVCLENKTWSGTRGSCELVRCKPFENVVDKTAAWQGINITWVLRHQMEAKILINDKSLSVMSVYGDIVELDVKCQEGHVYNGTSLTCGEHGQWEGIKGSCSVISCETLPPIRNGTVPDSGYVYNDTASITCDEGYRWEGTTPHAICTKHGTWRTSGQCKGFSCYGNPVSNGKLEGSDHLYPDVVDIICDEGYRWEGTSPHAACTADGTWTNNGQCKGVHPTSLVLGVFLSLMSVILISLFVLAICLRTRILEQFNRLKAILCGFFSDFQQNNGDENGDVEEETALMATSDSEDSIRSAVLSIGHVTNRNPDKKIDLDTQFVKIRLVTGGGYERMNEINDALPDHYQDYLERTGAVNIEIENILDHVKHNTTGEKKRKPLLLEGRAGVGKSTLVQWLMRLWAQKKWGNIFKAAFLFNIRNLTVVDKRPVSLITLFKHFRVHTLRHGSENMSIESLLENEEHTLIFLDGIDEFPGLADSIENCEELSVHTLAEPIEWCMNLMKQNVMGKSLLVLASRPYRDLEAVKCEPVLEVVGLTQEMVLNFIDHHVSADKIERVRAAMTSNPLVMSVSAITYCCMMFCTVLAESENISTEQLITYTRIAAFFAIHYMSRCPSDNEHKIAAACLSHLAKLAHKGLVDRHKMENRVRLVFDQSDLKESGVTDYIERMAEYCGLLVPMNEHMPDSYSEQVSEFVHLSIQELLAMLELRHKAQIITRNAAKMMWNSGSFLMAQQYLFGISYDLESEHICKLRQMMDHGNEQPAREHNLIVDLIKRIQEMTEGSDTKTRLQAIQMVYETQREDLAERVSHVLFDESQELVLTDTLLTAIDVNAIIFILEHTKSDCSLRIENITMDSTCGLVLAENIQRCKTLKGFIIRRTEVALDVIKAILKGLPRGTQLKTLGLDHVGLGKDAEHMKCIYDALKGFTGLTKLSLEGSQWTEAGLHEVAKVLKKQSTLVDLNLAYSGLNDATMRRFISIINSSTLKTLKLKGNAFNQEVAKVISSALNKKSSLQHLDLSDGHLDYSCLEILLEAVNTNKTLKTLDVRGEKMQYGLMDLLKNNRSLEALWYTNADDATVTLLTVPDTERWVQVWAAGNDIRITAWCLQDIASSSCLLHTHTVWGHQGEKLILQVDDRYTDLYGGGRPAVSADTWSLTLNQYTSSAHRMDTLAVFLSASASLSPLLTSLTPATIASLTHKLGVMWVYYGELSCTELISFLSSITTQPGWIVMPHAQGAEIITSHSHSLVIQLWDTRVRASLQQQQQHKQHLGQHGIKLLREPKWIIE